MTMLHTGAKFSGKAYETSGGLHGVGVSVVNALSERVEVTVWKDGFEWRQTFSRGKPTSKLEKLGPTRKHGTQVTFTPDPVIFGEDAAFRPARVHRMARTKAYLFRGVEIRWRCASERITDATPAEATFRFPNGIADFLAETTEGLATVTPTPFAGRVERQGEAGAVEWAVTWTPDGFGEADSFIPLLLQRHPHPRGRHPRGRPARGAQPWTEGPCRVGRREARRLDHRRRRDGGSWRDDQRLQSAIRSSRARPRSGSRRSTPSAWSRARCATRSTTGWPNNPRPPAPCWPSSSSGPRSG